MVKGWENYIAVLEKSVSKAAIIGADGKVWAKSESLPLSEMDIKEVLTVVKVSTIVAHNSIDFDGIHYITRLSQEGRYYGTNGLGGICIESIPKGYIVAVYNNTIAEGTANEAVGRIVDHLQGTRY